MVVHFRDGERLLLLVLLLVVSFVHWNPPLAYAEESRGAELFHQHCSGCHALTPPPQVAPPIRGVIRHYYPRYQDRTQFVEAVRDYVLNPQAKKAVCLPAVERFGVMPALSVPPRDVEAIAGWFWDSKELWPGCFR